MVWIHKSQYPPLIVRWYGMVVWYGGIGEQLVHGLACFIDHNICVSKRTEHFYTITTIMHY